MRHSAAISAPGERIAPGGGQDRPGHSGTPLMRGYTYVSDRPR